MDSLSRKASRYGYKDNSSTEFQRFKSEYFTGADVRIYFGDIWVDEITGLQFVLQEQVAPIFGYASYTWDKVARGSRYIEGSFTINFKESYYLHSALNRLSSVMRDKAGTQKSGFVKETWKEGLTVEHLVGGEEKFEIVADEFEKSFWGSNNNGQLNLRQENLSRETYFYPEYRGSDADGNLAYDSNNSQKALAENGFNILIGYGPQNERNGMYTPETTHSLIGVQLTGVSQIVDSSGQPIQEQYSFIAKDLDGDVTKITSQNNYSYNKIY